MLFALFTTLFAFTNAFVSITDCDPTSVFRPTQLGLYPDPPVSDQPFYLTNIFDNTGAEVNDGIVHTTVSINGIPYSETKALCEDTTCPILTGINNRSAESMWPSVTGKIQSTIKWTGVSGESLLCLQTTVKIMEEKGVLPYYGTFLRGNRSQWL